MHFNIDIEPVICKWQHYRIVFCNFEFGVYDFQARIEDILSRIELKDLG